MILSKYFFLLLFPFFLWAAPANPLNLELTALSQNSVHLQWQDLANNETGYKVWRGKQLIAILEADSTQYTDDGLMPHTTYQYTVKSTDDTKSYEDAEDGLTTGWNLYLGGEDLTMHNLYDVERQSKVIAFDNASDKQAGYRLGNFSGDDAWRNADMSHLSWQIKYNGFFSIYIAVETTKGNRVLFYSSQEANRGFLDNGYIHHGLGTHASDGIWHHFTRDLQADLQEYEADNTLVTVNGFLIRSRFSGRIDDIQLKAQGPSATKVFMIGASTVNNFAEGLRGWGTSLSEKMIQKQYFYNRARGGASSKSYKVDKNSGHNWMDTKNRMQQANINQGAYLLIHFGHNDESSSPDRVTQAGAHNSFYNELKVYVDEARALGITPVLITPVERLYKGVDTHQAFAQTVRDLALDTGVTLLDLQQKSFDVFDTYESTEAVATAFGNHINNGQRDVIHFNPDASKVVASWVIELACQADAGLCGLFQQ